jgi:hypothetical protein
MGHYNEEFYCLVHYCLALSSLLEERSCMDRKIKLQTFLEVLFCFFVCPAFGNGEITAGDTCGCSTIIG